MKKIRVGQVSAFVAQHLNESAFVSMISTASADEYFAPPALGSNTHCRCSSAVNKGRGRLVIDGEIGPWAVSTAMVHEALTEMGNVSDIDVVINSPGGYIGMGVGIHNALKFHTANIHTFIQGYALSMGSVIAMAGDTVSMSDLSLFMIHKPSGGMFGDADDLRHEADVLDKHQLSVQKAYTSRPGLTLSEEEVIAAVNAETWYTADEALAAGYIDQITETEDNAINAHAALLPESVFNNAPEWAHEIRSRAYSAAMTTPAAVGKTSIENEKMNVKDKPAAGITADSPQSTDDIVTNAANEARIAERKRGSDIRAAFANRLKDAPASLIDRYINDGRSVEDVELIITDMLELGSDKTPAAGSALVVKDESDKTREGITNAILQRAGKLKVARSERNSNEFSGLTLGEMANETLRRSGVRTSGNKMERVGAAFTHSSSDFPSVLQDIASRVLIDSYMEQAETFEQFTSVGSLPDFRRSERVGLLEMGELDRKPEGSEYKYTSVDDYKEFISLDVFGNKFSITREAIINDDLSAFTRVPEKMGRMARRTVGAKVFEVFAKNPAMADGTSLFHADHGNLQSAGAALSTASVDAALTAMALNKGRHSDNEAMQPMGIVPDILLVPMALRSRAITVMEAEFKVHAAASDSNRDPNSVRNAMRVVADARLDNISTSAWYLINSQMAPIERAYLDGEQEPFLESQRGWDIDGTEFKVRLDVGVAPMEYASIHKQPGA